MTRDAFHHTVENEYFEGSPDWMKPWFFEDRQCDTDPDVSQLPQSYILSEGSPNALDKAFILSDTPLAINDASTSSVSPVEEGVRLSSLLEDEQYDAQYGPSTLANDPSEDDDSFEGPMWSPGVDKLLEHE